MSWEEDYKINLTKNLMLVLENSVYEDITNAIVDVFKIHRDIDNSDSRLVFGLDSIPKYHPLFTVYKIGQSSYPGTYVVTNKEGLSVNIKDHLIERSVLVRLYKEGFDYVSMFSFK